MSLAADARDAVRKRPYLLTMPCAGVVNYAAVAVELDLDDDEAVTATLRRFAVDLSPLEADLRGVAAMMRNGTSLVSESVRVIDDGPVLSVAGIDLAGGGPPAAIIAEGEVDPAALTAVLSRLDAKSVVVDTADVAGDMLAVVVPRRQGATVFRIVEAAVSDLYI